MNFELVNSNQVLVTRPDGSQYTITTDDGSALWLYCQVTDWSELFEREDRAEELTQVTYKEAA
jgi:hypothetical protein